MAYSIQLIADLPFQRTRQEVQDVVEPSPLPDSAREAARVAAGDHAQLGQLLVQRPAADAVEPARPQHPLDLSPRGDPIVQRVPWVRRIAEDDSIDPLTSWIRRPIQRAVDLSHASM
jgi:hypothetical protein